MNQAFNSSIEEKKIFVFRIMVAVVFMLFLFGILLSNLINLQITKHQFYLAQADGNRYFKKTIAPIRGNIFDRNGVILAKNELSFSLIITPKYVKNIKKTLSLLKSKNIISAYELKKYYKKRKHYRSFNSIVLANRLNKKQMSQFIALHITQGLEIKPLFNRIYPHKKIASHILGYVSAMNKKDKKQYNSIEYKNTTHIGKIGIEKYYETELHGSVGFSKIEKNSQGKSLSEQILKNSVNGNNLYLTIDIRLQKIAQKLLKGKKGAIVMVDVRNGEILAAASAPNFDSNLFVNGISKKNYLRLQSKDKPLFNRIVKGVYPPGSTIKPFIAIAALEEKKIKIKNKILCKGYYQLPNHKHKFRDWKRVGHGHINVKDAIAQSCDVYFYNVSHKLGIKSIHQYLDYFGFGRKTGVDILGELSGTLPSKQWKKDNKDLPWYRGETIITGIGQGFLTATPLQLAISTAALSNNGTLYQPKFLKKIHHIDTNIIDLKKSKKSLISIQKIKNWKAVIAGMKKTIYDIQGTARRLNRKKLTYTLAGKTGTAQVFGLDPEEEYVAKKLDEKLRDHALFTGFAPIKNTEVAIAVIVENAGSGSSQAAPLAKKVLDAYFKNKL